MSAAKEIDYLSVDDLLEIADGVVGEVRVRDLGLLASAAGRPRAWVFGAEAYPRVADKGAALLHSLVRNHPLIDGNKRLAWSAMRAFCLMNGYDLRYSVGDAEALVLAAAAGDLDAPDIAAWITQQLFNA